MAAYRWVYELCHLWADYLLPGSLPPTFDLRVWDTYIPQEHDYDEYDESISEIPVKRGQSVSVRNCCTGTLNISVFRGI